MMTHREKDLNLSSDFAEYFFFTTESQNQVKDYIRVIYQKYSPWTDGTITLDLHNRNTYFHQLSQQWFKTDMLKEFTPINQANTDTRPGNMKSQSFQEEANSSQNSVSQKKSQ